MGSLSDKYKNNLPFDSSNVTTIISDYTALNNDVVFVNTASSALTVTLPASPTAGSKIKVLDVAANSQNNIITILGNGRNIGGASAYIINTPDSSAEFLFINNAKGWNVLNEYVSLTKPAIPISISAVDVGTGRAYNDGAATVSFTPSTEGDTATSYTVTSTPGSFSATGTSSPIVVTGLQSNTSYTFKVYASNSAGNSTESTASGSITATTVPQAPTIGTTTYGFEKVDVGFITNATGGKAISGYTVTSNPGSVTGSGASSPIAISLLTGGTSYTFTATATNANGTSAASSASSSATPFTATGGTTVSSSGYRYHTFTGSSNFSLIGNSCTTEYIVVAGGGGGGSSNGPGGGGGAGGFRYGTQSLNVNTYPVTVGAGGNGSPNFGLASSKGSNSSFSTFESSGGGRGTAWSQNASSTGGSGGGGGWDNNAGSGGNIGGYSPVEGFAGGNASQGAAAYGGGGGGGAGGAGGGGSGSGGGTGGAGTNAYGTWATATSTGVSGFYAGGGGGGTNNGTTGQGGSGGGGTQTSSRNAVINTGSGGAGNSGAAGAGGSGIVIIRYAI